nr:MAG TPA: METALLOCARBOXYPEPTIDASE INHIBITOR, METALLOENZYME INHIBITOR, PLANT DEFENSE [Caudoviricetes sp.]
MLLRCVFIVFHLPDDCSGGWFLYLWAVITQLILKIFSGFSKGCSSNCVLIVRELFSVK